MSDIRCPNCGRDNPDFFDACQFCQTPLKRESMLHIGDQPTKKNTGELEPVLPDWLKDVRKQSRDAAQDDEIQASSKGKAQKEEAPDLLAGLAFQSDTSDEEDIPDWLSSLSGGKKEETAAAPTAAAPENDFFAQFNKAEPAGKPAPVPEEETPSWMSGLGQQAQQSSEHDELSDWLTKASQEPAQPSFEESDLPKFDSGWEPQTGSSLASEQPEAKNEDLSWLHNLEAESKKPESFPPTQNVGWMNEPDTSSVSPQSRGQDDLDWLNNLGGFPLPEQTVPQSAEPKEDLNWHDTLGGTPASTQPAQQVSKPQDDLSWLNDFGASSPASVPEQQPSVPADDLGWLKDFESTSSSNPPAQQPVEPQDDLGWLSSFGETPAAEQPPVQTTSESKDDLGWLNNFDQSTISQQPIEKPPDDLSWLSGIESTPETPIQRPSETKDDLGWLNSFGAASEGPQQPTSQPQEDFSWLSSFDGTPQPSQPEATPTTSGADLSWLNDLQGSSESLSAAPFVESSFEQDQPEDEPGNIHESTQYSPAKTARLNPNEEVPVPDWLKSATEAPSMPVNAGDLDQFREDYNIPSAPEQPFSWKNVVHEPRPEEPSTLSNRDVDSLFSVGMPDWLSQPAPEESPKPAQEIGIHAEGGEALSPVDLPSWVQAMRPVEAVISDTHAVEDLPTEKEGPLAGFKGVIPVVPIGSSRRPQPVPLKLQATAEQQSSAAIMEQILASETSPRALLSTPVFTSQRTLRRIIAIVMWVLLGTIVFMRTQILPVSPVLSTDADYASRTLELIPDNSSVLVVLDYEPSLAGEMEAASGPLLNHLVLLRHPSLSFISTSPTGAGLVERLLKNTNINTSTGLGYQSGQNYFNLGYLPGGEAGMLTFIQSPDSGGFSRYSAVILLTDHADSSRAWVEQLQIQKQNDPAIVNQPLLVVSSAQAGPMLQPYVSSRQITGMVNGLADAARYEHKNNVPPGITRSYWDAFGVGVMYAVLVIVLGSLWSLVAGIRARHAEAGEA